MTFFSRISVRSFILGALIATVFAAALVAIQASTISRHNHESLIQSCSLGNDFRQRELKLWNHILGIPPAQPPTAQEQKQINDFKAYLSNTFQLRDCSKI